MIPIVAVKEPSFLHPLSDLGIRYTSGILPLYEMWLSVPCGLVSVKVQFATLRLYMDW